MPSKRRFLSKDHPQYDLWFFLTNINYSEECFKVRKKDRKWRREQSKKLRLQYLERIDVLYSED